MKAWKIAQLIGVLILLVGVIAQVGAGEMWGTLAMVIGVVLFAVGRVGLWLTSDKA